MGFHHPEVTITKGGIKGRVKHGHAKRKNRGRDIDDMTVITIREMRFGPRAGGELVIRSCNTCEWTLGAGWSSLAKERVKNRLLHLDGRKKGRVLLAELHCMNTEPVVVATACLHITRSDEITIDSFDQTTDLTGHRAELFAAMLIAVERVACKMNQGRQATVIVNCSKDDAWWYKDRFGFKQKGVHPRNKNRRLLGRREHAPCRPSAKRQKGSREANVRV